MAMQKTSTRRRAFDRTRQTAPQIADVLRDEIMALALKPGTQLSRVELQDRFGVSQTPVRDALLKLEEEGLVTIFPQHATLISRVDIGKAREVHFMRRAIEADVCRKLAEDRPAGIVEALHRANEIVRIEAKGQDQAAFLIADRAFHRVMFEHVGLMAIWDVLQANIGHLDRLRRLNLGNVGVERIVRQHDLIIDRIAAGDPDGAGAALREHLSNTLAMLDRVGAEFPEYIDG